MKNKINIETLANIKEQVEVLSTPELEVLNATIDALIEERERLVLVQNQNKEQLLCLFKSRGYYLKPGDKFYKVKGQGRGNGFYGWQVGQYQHSCHIDTSDMIVLLIVEPGLHGETYVIDSYHMWLEGPIIV